MADEATSTGIRCNVHLTISGVVGSAEQLQPIVSAIGDVLNKVTGDCHFNAQLYATTTERLEAKRRKDLE